jgi:TRAP-type C4-dicarboxylate transport system permease large subunit
MLLAIILGAQAFSQILVFSGFLRAIAEWVLSLPIAPIIIVMCMILVVLILGCFMDALAIVLMVVPLYMPIIHFLKINPLWFGLLLLISVETSLVTPPFGLCLFVMKGVAPPDTTIGELYRSAWPFIAMNLFVLGLCIAFPVFATWLPGIVSGR